MSFLNIQSVSKSYAEHKALDNVSIEVPEQSVFGLLGPNGAGKTSLIRIINQITAPDQGEIIFKNEKLKPEHIADIGYLPEERGLYKKMEVGEQVIYLARLKGMSRNDARKELKMWFTRFEMQTWWHKKIEELSKGMQQKVQFIVTVVHKPKLLILDEPFTGFDPINANLIRDELMELNKQGSTILLSTHRMETVEALCTHIALINRSKKVLDGEVQSVRKSFNSNVYSIDYIGNSIALANALWGGYKLISNTKKGEISTALVELLEGNKPNNLLKALVNEVEVYSFGEVIPSMSDIFIRAIGEDILVKEN